MIQAIIIIALSRFFDGLITNYIPYQFNNLSLFTPELTVIGIFLVYPLFKKNKKNYFLIIFFSGFIYDLLYTDLIFVNAFLFLLLGYITKIIYSNLEVNVFKLVIYLILLIILYETLLFSTLFIFNKIDFIVSNLFYKIINSILLNVLYGILGYLIINKFVIRKNRKRLY